MSRLRHHNHKITSKGYYVCAINKQSHTWRPSPDEDLRTIRYISGRVTEDSKGEWLEVALYQKWDLDGKALDHDLGDLILKQEDK